jgi:hypothetical protein
MRKTREKTTIRREPNKRLCSARFASLCVFLRPGFLQLSNTTFLLLELSDIATELGDASTLLVDD